MQLLEGGLDARLEVVAVGVVGEDEASIADGLISYVSPLAKALHGAEVGDVVTWARPAGEVELEVLRIEYF